MKTNLSSQISLHRVSPRYYRPENAFEKSVLTRLEKIPTDIYESVEEGANYIAREIAQTIREKQKAGRFCVLALPGGDSPSHVYTELIRMHKEEGLSFRNVIVFNMYEYYPLSPDAINSNFNALKSMLLDHIDIDKQNIFTPDGSIAKDTIFEYCRLYEQRIESFGGIDIALLGIGRVGNIAFNEPGSRLNSTTRLILLDNASRNEASKIFGTLDNTPISSITMGVATILGAKKVYLLAWGENKAAMIKECVEGPITDTIPASYLQTHNNAHVALDLSAAMNLTRIQRPWLVTSCEWNDKLIRSAIVWLCQLTGKPILKLTNKDYNENGLSELLALYGSAYNVNIKIFNDLQHTITGWPGGKPNADDTYRPERAKPYPKRVVIFSPHPDDDVISMGGTLRRLVEQKHEVHVAYETSGNIAVGDEEVVRFMHFINGFNQIFFNFFVSFSYSFTVIFRQSHCFRFRYIRNTGTTIVTIFIIKLSKQRHQHKMRKRTDHFCFSDIGFLLFRSPHFFCSFQGMIHFSDTVVKLSPEPGWSILSLILYIPPEKRICIRIIFLFTRTFISHKIYTGIQHGSIGSFRISIGYQFCQLFGSIDLCPVIGNHIQEIVTTS